MAWTPPGTFVAGVQALASWMNEMVRDNLIALWPFTARGDIAFASSSTTLTKLAAGDPGQIIQYNADGDLQVCDNRFNINFILGNGRDIIDAGTKLAAFTVPQAITIDKVQLISVDNTTGSIVVNIYKNTWSNVPTSTTSICASSKPMLSSAVKYEDTTLTSWTITFAEGDILIVTAESVTALKLVQLAIMGVKI